MNTDNEWWHARKEELIALAAKESPLYVYNEETLNETFFDLSAIDAINGLLYPVHANPHPKILRKAFELNVDFMCISSDEITRILKNVPELTPKRIVFVPDHAQSEDFEYAFHYGLHVVVKGFYPFKVWPDTFKNREIFICMAMSDDEAGLEPSPPKGPSTRNNCSLLDRAISLFEVKTVLEILNRLEISLKGLYTYPENNLPRLYDMNETISFLVEASGQFPEVSTFILGHGMGLSVNPEKGIMDIPLIDDYLEEIRGACPQPRLWLEPGDYMVSHAGALLARVTETGEEEGMRYIRTNTEMKPAMYNRLHGASHQIVNLTRLANEETTIVARIIGQEKGAGNAINLVKIPASVQENDILLFTNMGACGPETGICSKGQKAVSERYLSSRSLCQVRWTTSGNT